MSKVVQIAALAAVVVGSATIIPTSSAQAQRVEEGASSRGGALGPYIVHDPGRGRRLGPYIVHDPAPRRHDYRRYGYGEDWRWRHRGWRAFGYGECRVVVRQRINAWGELVFVRRRICD